MCQDIREFIGKLTNKIRKARNSVVLIQLTFSSSYLSQGKRRKSSMTSSGCQKGRFMLREKWNLLPSEQLQVYFSSGGKLESRKRAHPSALPPPFPVSVAFYSPARYRKGLVLQVILVRRKQTEFGGMWGHPMGPVRIPSSTSLNVGGCGSPSGCFLASCCSPR